VTVTFAELTTMRVGGPVAELAVAKRPADHVLIASPKTT